MSGGIEVMDRKSRAKSAIFYAVLVIGVVAVVELLAFASYSIAFHERFSYDLLQSLRVAAVRSAEESSAAGHIQAPAWVIHPYYGYVYNPTSSRGLDRFGFWGHHDQIQTAGPDKIIVAVVGGSVAAQLASSEYSGDRFEAELKNIPFLWNKQIVILNFGNGAFKQPQALIAINDILSRGGHIDLLIALDGFNEIALPEAHGDVNDGISPFYPQHWRWLVEGEPSPAQLNAMAKWNLVSRVRVTLAANFSRPILKQLVTANFFWRVADQQLESAWREYRIAIDQQAPADPASRLTKNQRAFLGPSVKYGTRRELYVDIARQWGRSSVLMNNIMSAQGGRYFQFLQPNQNLPGSKPLSAQEKNRVVYPASIYRKPVEIGYPYMRAMGASLRSAGLWFEDLTGLFAENSEDLYLDNCCHLNNEGMGILARTIATAIAARLATGDKAHPLPFKQVDFADALFANRELRRFSFDSSDYNDGSQDLIGNATQVTQPSH